MECHSRYPSFDPRAIRTYPIGQRRNKVTLERLADPAAVRAASYDVGDAAGPISEVSEVIVAARRAGKPVICFTGAHLVKNGLGPLLADLVRRGMVTLVATNGAGVIHDFELALIGETSEHVPNALGKGQFGMAHEFAYINRAIAEGHARGLGLGESLGATICDAGFRAAVEKRADPPERIEFRHPDESVLRWCYEQAVPLTVHVGIGTDVIDQHPSFDGAAKGGCSGRDFLIYTAETGRLGGGAQACPGVVLNIGSAVTGPEVLLKAVSMVSNVGRPPTGLITADFDLKPYHAQAMTNERDMHYYFRDHKSVVTRVPEAFGGRGVYVQGDQILTVPRLYQEIVKRLHPDSQ